MTDWIREILSRYGQKVTIQTTDGQVPAQAFLQPVTEKTEQVPDDFGGLGWMDGRLWLYLGDTAADTGATVTWNGRRFRVRSGRPWYVGRRLNHWWAVLEAAMEAAE